MTTPQISGMGLGMEDVLGIEARNGFLPPRYEVYRAVGAEWWERAGSVPVLMDLLGEEVTSPADIRMGWDEARLLVRAVLPEEAERGHPDPAPASDDFWRQDHVELRLVPADGGELEQVQFILGRNGKFWDSRGVYRQPSDTSYRVSHRRGEWVAEFSVVLGAIGVVGSEGTRVRGLLAHTRWRDAGPVYGCSSPVNLGFGHRAHLGEWRLCGPAGAVVLRRVAAPGGLTCPEAAVKVTLARIGDGARDGEVVLRADDGREIRTAVRLDAAETVHRVTLPMMRPAYARWGLQFVWGGTTVELGAITWRGAVPALSGMRGEHPCLLLSPERLAETRQKLALPAFASLVRSAGMVELAEHDASVHGKSRNLFLLANVGVCLTRWVVDADIAWVQRACAMMQRADQETVLGEQIDLHEGNVSFKLGLAYDTWATLLGSEERAVWRRVLGRMLELHLKTARAWSWNTTTIANANPVCNGGGGMIALALLGEHPDAEEAVQLARKFVRLYLDYAYGADGGCTEGVQYWAYGLESLTRFAAALRCVTTRDDLLAHPAITKAAANLRVAHCNDGKLHGINDTIPMPVAAELAWRVAAETGEKLPLWYADHGLKVTEDMKRRGKPIAYEPDPLWGLLNRPAVAEEAHAPALPTACVLHDIEVGMLRSSPEWNCRLDAGLKGSRPPYTHHNQPDTGAFFLDVRGERLLIDPGYYKEAVADHSLILIDDCGPVRPTTWTGRIFACQHSAGVGYLAVDATRAYAGRARRVQRHLIMLGDRAVILVDDVLTSDPAAVLTLQYQAGGVTSAVGGRGVLIAGERARVQLQLLTPAVSLNLQHERSFHDTHWGYHFAECRWFPVLTRTLAGHTPIVTGIADITDGPASSWRCVREGDTLAISLQGVGGVCFASGPAGWQLIG